MTMQAENQPQAARQSAVREMSDHDLGIRVAELCPSLFVIGRGSFTNRFAYWSDGGRQGAAVSPACDLNAMHAAEKARGWHDDSTTTGALRYFLIRSDICNEFPGFPVDCATARQRAEAFVLTLAPSLPAAVQPDEE